MVIRSQYYEQPEFWDENYWDIPDEKQRLEKTIELIPNDVETILDAGCGNGAFLNALPLQYLSVGLDSSEEALKHVQQKTFLGSVDSMPFKDKSFDLVTCLEVLEHLPCYTFHKAIDEIERISKKYIIVSVPNRERLFYSLVACPACRCHFNSHYHMRTFDPHLMETIFPNYVIKALMEVGPEVRLQAYHDALIAAYRALRKPSLPKTAICPQCGYQGQEEESSKERARKTSKQNMNLIASLMRRMKFITRLIWPEQQNSRWLLGLYEIRS